MYNYGHYVSLVNPSRVKVEHYKLVDGFYPGQAERCFQHFRVRVEKDDDLVSIIHCHAPSSQKRNLTNAGRLHYISALHKASNGDRFIWGGDFNIEPVKLSALMEKLDCRYTTQESEDSSAAQPESMRFVYSNPNKFMHGDMAVTYGLCGVQQNSEVGKSYGGASDNHDLVIARVFGTGDSNDATPPGSTVANSAAQPAPERPFVTRAANRRVIEIFGTDDDTNAPLQELLEKIAKEYIWGHVANIVATATECYDEAAAPPVLAKLEAFLEIIQEQRARHLGLNPHLAEDAVFSTHDMEEITKRWQEDYRSWMKADTVKKYQEKLNGKAKGDHQRAHQIRRSAFSAFLFQFLGNKHVLMASIQHPICSAVGSATQRASIILGFMTAWEKEKTTPEYWKRRQLSERLTDHRRTLKMTAHEARQELVQAAKIHDAIRRGSQVEDLSPKEKELLDDFNSGKLTRNRDKCNAAFGWNRQMRSSAGSAAARLGR